MLFNDHPERIFIKSQIEIVIFHDGVGGDDMTEKIFEGPIHYQIRDTLNFIKNNIIQEHVRKLPDRAEAERVFNYPYNALEEALVNAMFHRSYEIREPVEVRVYPDKIIILSYPGPDRSIRDDDLKKGEIVGRRYRNRKIGDFFKELKITEGKSTGIPKILRAMKNNVSPVPVFSTDEDRTYFIVTLPINRYFKTKKIVSPPRPENRIFAILQFCLDEPHSRKEILEHIGLKNVYGNYKNHILPLVDMDLLQLTVPEKPTSNKQQYITTNKGEKFMVE
jgi:ATP-dependent DNA helicase RecG